jgi:hypothetical protein
MNDYKNKIEYIIKNFDFDKVHKTMQALDWKWFDSCSEDGIPTTGELVLKALELLEEAAKYNEDEAIFATGGFYARKSKDVLSLSFSVSDWDTETYQEEGYF